MVAGFDWGAPAWSADISGFLAGAAFAFVCAKASNTSSAEGAKELKWIAIWSSITAAVRVLDTLMLFGVVKIEAIYHEPEGAVLTSNIVSEVAIGNACVRPTLRTTGGSRIYLPPSHLT